MDTSESPPSSHGLCKHGHSLHDAYHYTRAWTSKRTGVTREYPVIICKTCSFNRSTARSLANHKRRPEPQIPSDPLILSYVAGLFDGEGSVMIRFLKKKGQTEHKYHALAVSITSTDRPLVDWLAETFGGRVTQNHRENAARNYKDAWKWQLLSRHAAAFLQAVRPFLRLKGPQADLAFELRATTGRGRSVVVTDELFAHRERIRADLHTLNRRGRNPIEET